MFFSFYHGKLGMMGNLAGWNHDTRMHELWDYLPENSPSMNANAIAKLGEAKFLHFVHLSSLCICPPWNQGALHECWVVARCSKVVFFLFPAKS